MFSMLSLVSGKQVRNIGIIMLNLKTIDNNSASKGAHVNFY